MIRGIRKVFILFPILWGYVSAYQESDMQLGFYRYSGSTAEQQRNLIWDLEDAALSKGADEFRSIQAVVATGESSTWGVLSDKLNLGLINLESRAVFGPWPLTRWEHDTYAPEEITTRYNDYGRDIDEPDSGFGRLTVGMDSLGCMPSTPLRYGDFTSDGNPEIVVIFSNDIVVFSPQEQAVIFSQRLRIGEWFGEQETHYYRAAYMPDEVPGNAAQYLSRVAVESQGKGPLNWRERGYRGYGKLYRGSFSGSGSQDVLVWHKLYRSRLESDPLRGFERVSDHFLHYRMVDGEYLPQSTSNATIRGWLNVHDLTWRKGFPSHSECPGEEGELIPEMHDPLLNDPDVLQ